MYVRKPFLLLLIGALLVTLTCAVWAVISLKNSAQPQQYTSVPSIQPTITETISPTQPTVTMTEPSDGIAKKVVQLQVLDPFSIDVQGRSFVFSYNQQPGNQVIVNKVRDPDNPNYKGFVDTGFTVTNGSKSLSVSPAFEGAGTGLERELNPAGVTNAALSQKPIYRLLQDDVMGKQNSRGGYDYTTQYTEGVSECNAFGSNTPACISGGLQIFTTAGPSLSIHCNATEQEAVWCDDIVSSLTVLVNKP